jgi:hypothetical protein
MGIPGERAVDLADRAANRTGEDKLTDVIGEGLGAVAYALLELAAALQRRDRAPDASGPPPSTGLLARVREVRQVRRIHAGARASAPQ